MSEKQQQTALFRWARMQRTAYPELRLLIHIPNGGRRDKVTAWQLKQEGVKAGVSDLLLPVPRGGYHGLWLELKNDKPRGVVTAEQRQWLADMDEQGYAADVAYGWEMAVERIQGYLGGEERPA